VDGGVHAEKTLGGASRLKALQLALASSHHLMRVFDAIILRNPCSCVCFSTEPGPHVEKGQHSEIEYEYSRWAGSRSAPIGTPSIPEISVLYQDASGNSAGVPLRW
jgi:hypothetical protein